MKPGVIVCWPDTIDYPLFRKFIKEERAKFAKIIIAFTETNWGDTIIDAVKEKLKDLDITFIICDAAYNGEDWRNNATNKALKLSDSEWVLFLEQDFFPSDKLLDQMLILIQSKFELVYIDIDKRMHPAFLLIKRSILEERTSKDFSANPPHYDHFGKVQREIWEIGVKRPPLLWYKIPDEDYYHMAGLTHNLYLEMIGQKAIYKPEEFEDYKRKVKEYENSSN